MSRINVDKYNKETTDRRALKIKRRIDTLNCAICPPNRGENSKRKPKHGIKKKRKPRDE